MQWGQRTTKTWAWACALALLGGCATRSADVAPRAGDPALYAAWDCERLFDEIDRVQQRAADVAYAVDARVGNNMIALGLGVMVFWPALLAMRPDGMEAAELSELKGRFEALRTAADRKSCGPLPVAMAANRAASLPIALGERLVYEDRSGAAGAPRELGMQVQSLRRDQIEFQLDLDGRKLPGLWRQDLAGNSLPAPQRPLMGWQRLLRRDLELGQVLTGDLSAGDATQAVARVRGQVVAIGPQNVAGHSFDVAVIELFGDAPQSGGAGTSTRLDGVMAVDRRSGVLLRIELRCANSEFALRRRLLRVESAAH